MQKKLYRSNDKIIAGVLGGVGEYFDTDPTLIRLAYILIAIMTAVVPAIIAYIIAALIVPMKPSFRATEATYTETAKKEEPKNETA